MLTEITNFISTIYKPVKLRGADIPLLIELMAHDKKNEGTSLCFALPKGVGAYELYCGVNIDAIKKAIGNY